MTRDFGRPVRRRARRTLVFIVGSAFVLAQFVPVNQANPPVEEEVIAPADVMSVLRRSCYDCHSNETTWPWYSQVAPVSWLVARDVREGREAVNYSTWGRYDDDERAEKRAETWEDVGEGEMPMGLYTLMHPDARLSDADRAALRSWGLAVPVNHIETARSDR